jgi:phosphoenolpyruvate carboxykinase (ATP)
MATQTKPNGVAARRESSHGLEAQGLRPSGTLHWNLVAPELIQAAVRRGEGELADMGPFAANTAPHTGRSPNDKFVVREPSSE